VDGRDVSEEDYHVTHNPAAGRFEIRTASGTALLNYAHAGEDLDLVHTEVPDALEGQGYASALARAALDYERRERIHVIPSCPFVAEYIARHPDDAELVAHD
jgi:predicted GNAT family acetyltransferase